MEDFVKIKGSLLVRNTALNFTGQAVPLLAGLFAIPYVIHGLGVERFGILSLAWLVIGYFSLLDLGLRRATTKLVAEELGRGGNERISAIVWTSLGALIILGMVGAIIFVIGTPLLVQRVLKISPNFIPEVKSMFYLLSCSIPVVVSSAGLRGILEGGQHFDLVNVISIPSGALNFIMPLVGTLLRFSLPSIVLLQMITITGSALAYFFLSFKAFPWLKHNLSLDRKTTVSLFSYGGWITLINILSLVITRLGQFLIGSLLSMAAVTYYTAPYMVVTKLWTLPQSLFITIFPVFSALGVSHKGNLERLLFRNVKYLIVIIGPIVLILILFANEGLRLWLGNDFAEKSTLVFQILAIGFFLNCLVWIPSTLLQGIGRPDIVAKLFLVEAPFYAGAAWWLIAKMGIEGAALAWVFRGGLEVVLFFGASRKLISFHLSALAQNGILRAIIALGGLILAALFMTAMFDESRITQVIGTLTLIIFFALGAWCYTLDDTERNEMKAGFLLFASLINVKK
jgi:O-antigen/teichoic acid export membrane protein